MPFEKTRIHVHREKSIVVTTTQKDKIPPLVQLLPVSHGWDSVGSRISETVIFLMDTVRINWFHSKSHYNYREKP